ncbi:HWE histidine kinase domain-containing protein [Dankookia sp. P2]|uniref:HWE histidine kinase domain-containing protein n=1 Tax=Dankookia sp. P2 TaxID=3423955 RepID=UPI003D66954D
MRRYAGVVEDITGRKAGERALELLVRELDHRVKNQFAVFDGLIQFTARGAADPAGMAAALRGRVNALAVAHDLVRDASGSGPARGLRPTTLAALAAAVLGPFGTRPPGEAGAESGAESGPAADAAGRIVLHGPPVGIGPAAAAALALALHELATNSARHGALSQPQGRVALSWEATTAPAIRLVWRETGGPALAGPPERRGFGATLIRQSVTHQLGGQVGFDWSDPAGLAVTLDCPEERLAR